MRRLWFDRRPVGAPARHDDRIVKAQQRTTHLPNTAIQTDSGQVAPAGVEAGSRVAPAGVGASSQGAGSKQPRREIALKIDNQGVRTR
eukprot:4788701-Prymnesium_polylepis.1